MSTYFDTLKPEAETKIKPLAATVAKLGRELDDLRHDAKKERGNVEGLEERLTGFKAKAGEWLAGGKDSRATFKVRLKHLAGDLAAAKETVAVYDGELIPAAERALAEAKRKVQAALLDMVRASMPTCEQRMAELLGAVLAEREDFMAAADSIFSEYGGDFTGKNRVYPDG